MKKIFKNVEGNQFKLLTESYTPNENSEHVSSGLRKVFSNGHQKISYSQIEAVGLGYIKDINEAKRVALSAARNLIKEYGYDDDEESRKFVKDSPNARPLKENDGEMSDYDKGEFENGGRMVGTRINQKSEERREVEIGKEIINLTAKLVTLIPKEKWGELVTPIQALAKELIEMYQ